MLPTSTQFFKNAPLIHFFHTSMKVHMCCSLLTFCSMLYTLQSILWRAAVVLLLTLNLLRYFYAVLMLSSTKMLLDVHFLPPWPPPPPSSSSSSSDTSDINLSSIISSKVWTSRVTLSSSQDTHVENVTPTLKWPQSSLAMLSCVSFSFHIN